MRLIFLLFLLISGASFAGSSSVVMLDQKLSPGKLCSPEDPDFWRTFVHRGESVHICNRNVSASLKYQIVIKYGIDKRKRKNYKIDHVIPLNIGGSNDPSNLFPIDKKVAKYYERAEWPYYKAFRNDLVSPSAAQQFVLSWKINYWNEVWVEENETDLFELEEMFPNIYDN